MNLTILLPEKTYWHEKVKKIVGEDVNGSFCLLPGHIDYITVMVPGILYVITNDGQDSYIAINGGILLKIGKNVTLATRNAVREDNLTDLRGKVEEDFKKIDEHYKKAHHALQKLEADFIRRFLDLEAHG